MAQPAGSEVRKDVGAARPISMAFIRNTFVVVRGRDFGSQLAIVIPGSLQRHELATNVSGNGERKRWELAVGASGVGIGQRIELSYLCIYGVRHTGCGWSDIGNSRCRQCEPPQAHHFQRDRDASCEAGSECERDGLHVRDFGLCWEQQRGHRRVLWDRHRN